MTIAFAVLLLAVALIATLRAVTAHSTERLLWGSLVASACLGLAVQVRGGGYYGILMVAVFVVTDLVLYLFFRSLRLLPDRPARNARGDRAYRVFFLWLTFCVMAVILLLAFAPADQEIWSAPSGAAMELLNSRVWAGDWILAALPILGLVVLVTGGFFLVRRDS
jgi:hypothetical protein